MVNKLLLWGAAAALLCSCKSEVPKGILDRGEMENLLYDYHLAQSLAKNAKDSVYYRTRVYIEAVYRKYGVDEEGFNRSMEWYTRNSEELFEIYKRIDKRFSEVKSTGGVQGNRYATMTEPGDTMNIWKGKDFYLLTNSWNNHLDFDFPADSLYAPGDRLMWQFDTQWYYRDGSKTAQLVLAVVYDNDSVASVTQSLYGSGEQEVNIRVGDRPVKSVAGLLYLAEPWAEQPKILTVSEPVLVRFRKKKKLLMMKDVLHGDSLATGRSGEERPDTAEQPAAAAPERILHLPR